MKPELVMLAGPNGAGKSTFYDTYLSQSPLLFLNADILAARENIDSFEAARILDAARDRLVERGESFITETVFSDPSGLKLRFLQRAQTAGFDVTLIYIGVDPAILRSLKNLREAIPVIGTVRVFDNSVPADPYRLLARFAEGAISWSTSENVPAWAKGIIPTPRKKPRKR